jgi:hypothetical protein
MRRPRDLGADSRFCNAGHYFIRDGEYIYETSASADKKFIVLEGANHGLGPCAPCAALHNSADYSQARINLFNFIRNWVSDRYEIGVGAFGFFRREVDR